MAQTTLYRKKLIEPGEYQSPQGKCVVTPARIDHWEKSFNALRSEGFNFPAPWGHKLNATPTEQDPYAAEEAYARWNSGNVRKLEKDKDGSLWMVGEVPPGYEVENGTGRLVNSKDGTVVTDVSPGIGNWTDGQGRHHEDIILHAALCTHPVQHNQTGFLPVEASSDLLPESVRLLSTAGKVTITHLLQTKGPSMADDKKKPKDEDAKVEVNIEDDDDSDDVDSEIEEGDGLPPAPDAEAEMPELPDGTKPAEFKMPGKENESTPQATTKQDEYVQMLMGDLAEMGQPMIDGTDRNNILERLAVLIRHAKNTGATLTVPEKPGTGALDALSVPGVPDQSGVGGMAGSYNFMSSKTNQPITLDKVTAKYVCRDADAEKKAIAAEYDRLASVGPAAMQAWAHKRKKKLEGVHFLSVNPETGDVMLKQARQELADFKEAFKCSGYHETMAHLLSTGVIVQSPLAKAEEVAVAQEKSKKADPTVVDDLLSRMR